MLLSVQSSLIIVCFIDLHNKVYRGDGDKAQDTIIGFYNEFYMVAMKSTILQFATDKVSLL